METFRGVAHVKTSWSKFTYTQLYTITIARYPDYDSVNAQEWATQEISRMAIPRDMPDSAKQWCGRHPGCRVDKIVMPKFQEIESRSIPVCGGQSGWLNAYTFTGADTDYEHVFVRAGNLMYVALFEYPTATGDAFHAADSLRTLCPPNAGEAKPLKVDVPFKPPLNWIRSARSGEVSGYTQIGGWYHVPAHSYVGESLILERVSDTSEYATPQQTAAEWIAELRQNAKAFRVLQNHAQSTCNASDRWLSVLSFIEPDGAHSVVEIVYAYGGDNLYLAQYWRSATVPEDPRAHKSLLSLCPPQAAPAPATPATPQPLPTQTK